MDLSVERMIGTSAVGSPDVRTPNASPNGTCRCEKNIIGSGESARGSLRTFPTTPITVTNGWLGSGGPHRTCWPMASSFGKHRFANASLMTMSAPSGTSAVRGVEGAPRDERDTERPEEVVVHARGPDERDWLVRLPGPRLEEDAVSVGDLRRHRVGNRDTRHAGERLEAFLEVLLEGEPRHRLVVASRQRHREGEDALGVEAHRRVDDRPEAARGEPRRGKQAHAEGDLAGDQHPPPPAAADALRGATGLVAQRALHVGAPDRECGAKPERDPGEERQREGHANGAGAERDADGELLATRAPGRSARENRRGGGRVPSPDFTAAMIA